MAQALGTDRHTFIPNRNLIAAAPEMYEALEAAEIMLTIMLACWGNTHTNNNGKFRAVTTKSVREEVSAALAKADGGAR